MSQPEAALYIQVPMFEITVAVHTTVNVAWRSGLHGETATDGESAAVLGISPRLASTITDPSGV